VEVFSSDPPLAHVSWYFRVKSLAQALLNWYENNARQLPWRGSRDPYAIWVSEIMLQQTRVETAIPYYITWMSRFPTLRLLAEATEQDVLAIWEGLGYYSRARNIHKAARLIFERYSGVFPRDMKALLKLPGIGVYTAAAIASIAFAVDVPAVDGNVKRVFSRLINLELPIESPGAIKIITETAWEDLPVGRAGDYNQALMDLSTAICLPRVPRCLLCPLRDHCQALAVGGQAERPVRKIRQPIPHHTVTAAVIDWKGKYLIARRPASGLLGGLWEFPGGKLEPGETLPECLRREIKEELGADIIVGEELGVFQHAYTHFRITLHAFWCRLDDREIKPVVAEEVTWVPAGMLNNYPMGKVDRLIARRLQENDG
jgi:A/G-specific adenine glycosylase